MNDTERSAPEPVPLVGSLAPGHVLACVDIGGTKVAVTLARREGLSVPIAEPTAKTGDNDALAVQVARLIETACEREGLPVWAVQAVGVAACGPFLMVEGMIELATPNICGGLAAGRLGLPNQWRSARIEQPLRERFGRVVVANDAVAALVAERRWGALRGFEHCAYVTWSTGIGMGVCVDGRVVHGKNGNAGHLGHSFVNDDPEGRLCGCGNVGDLEAQVSGSAIERHFGTSAADLLNAADRGEARAVAIVDELCRVLGRALYDAVVLFDLQRISVGGAVFWHHRQYLLPRLQAQLDGRLPALTDGVALVPAGLGLQVGDYGALALVA